jgi:GNAT superfamily N-acetyltransferase
MQEEMWAHAREFLARAPEDPFAHHLLWLEEDRRPVACVQVFLHRYPIGCAQVGMCLPEYPFVPPPLRGRGWFRRLMRELFAWMVDNGYPLAYSHGRKGLYTGIGYAPCFHHCTVLLRVADALKLQAPNAAEQATPTDVEHYARQLRRPFPLGRGLQCRDEAWTPDAERTLLVRNENLRGFAVLGHVQVQKGSADFDRPGADDVADVTDARASDAPAAAALLRAAAQKLEPAGFDWLRINCRREDPLARVAVLAGGQLRWSAAQERMAGEDGEDVDAFYLASLRLALEQLQPELSARLESCDARKPGALTLAMEEQSVTLRLGEQVSVERSAGIPPVVRLPRQAMTRAIMGYATPTELALLHEGCSIPPEASRLIDALLPAREPHLIHEDTAFAAPEAFGIIP